MAQENSVAEVFRTLFVFLDFTRFFGVNMRKRMSLFITLLFLGCGGDKITNTLEDRNGVKYEQNAKNPFSGQLIIKYPSGQLKLKQFYESGRIIGLSEKWYENGQLKSSEPYNDSGLLNGEAKYWEESGELKEVILYNKGYIQVATDEQIDALKIIAMELGRYIRISTKKSSPAKSNLRTVVTHALDRVLNERKELSSSFANQIYILIKKGKLPNNITYTDPEAREEQLFKIAKEIADYFDKTIIDCEISNSEKLQSIILESFDRAVMSDNFIKH